MHVNWQVPEVLQVNVGCSAVGLPCLATSSMGMHHDPLSFFENSKSHHLAMSSLATEHWHWPLSSAPIFPDEPGTFGAVRTHDIHTGVGARVMTSTPV